jgi:hypothetical protein
VLKVKTTFALALALALTSGLAGCGGTGDDGDDTDPPVEPYPSWGVPISGGTLLVMADRRHAVAADPDRDRVVVADVDAGTVVHTIALSPGDEPGRVVEDGAGRVHVALRRGGALVTIDPLAGTVVARRAVCAEPRGVAWDAATDLVHVACTDGQLVTFAAAGGDATRRLQLDRDLRDVVVAGDRLVVTRFRTVGILTVDAAGTVVGRTAPPIAQRPAFVATPDNPEGVTDSVAAVAWRAIALPDGRVVISHQRHVEAPLGTGTSEDGDGYGGPGGGCGVSPIETALTVVSPDGVPRSIPPLLVGPLAVDVAMSPAGELISVAVAGTGTVHTFWAGALAITDDQPCPPTEAEAMPTIHDRLGAPTSIAYVDDGRIAIFYPESPALVVQGITGGGSEPLRMIRLPGEVGYDAGRETFHMTTSAGLACASCHPEGRDDGQVWSFDVLGERRTQSVAGNILARAPYHWTGDQVDLDMLISVVFQGRMGGEPRSLAQREALGRWLDRIPAPAPIVGAVEAIERGRALFESAEVGCAACHNGPLYTNNQKFDVGTGELVKVPSLRGIAARPPFLHTGCAPTLEARLTDPCGGGDRHGVTSQLTAEQRADLVTFLESL